MSFGSIIAASGRFRLSNACPDRGKYVAKKIRQVRMTGGVVCPRCKHENTAQAKFCEECAAPLARTCSSCGTKISPAAKFCPECGRSTTEPRFNSPTAYTPKHLAGEILATRTAIEGERKHVTGLLFADLKVAELVAERDAEEAPASPRSRAQARDGRRPLLRGHGQPRHGRRAHGDLWRACGACGSRHPRVLRGAADADRRQERARRKSTSQRASPFIRVGLNSGNVVVRSISNDLRMDYTALGETVGLAARSSEWRCRTRSSAPGTLSLVEDYLVTSRWASGPSKACSIRSTCTSCSVPHGARRGSKPPVARGLSTFS